MARKLKGQQQTLMGSPSGTFVNFASKPIQANRAPTTADTGYEIGQLWADTNGTTMYGLSAVSAGSATWNLLGPGASDVDTLTGDSGGALSPSGGNITLAGGTNITTAGSASTITFNLDAAITLATSVTSPDYTAAGGSDLQITAPSGQDAIITLGDSAGATSFIVEALDGTDVFTVDSTGTIAFTNLANTGTFTTSGGLASINASSNNNTVINSGTSTGTVTIGNGAAGDITVDTAAGVAVNAATASNFSVSGATEDLTLASAAGTVIVNAGEDAADAIYLHADAGISETIRLHADQGTGAASIHLESDAGGVTLTSTGLASNDAINLNAAAGGVDIDGALQVNIASSENAADAVRINASAGGIDIDAAGAAGEDITLDNAAGSIGLTAGEADAAAISIQASAGGVDVDGALQVNIASSQNAADAVRINASAGGIDIDAAGAAGEDITLDNAAGSIGLTAGEADAGAISLQAASGGLDIDAGLAIIADAAGNVEVNSSAGQILIGNDDVDQNAEFATDGERTVTVGSTNGAAGLVLQAGTGEITVTGTVKEIDAEFLEASGDEITSISQSPILTTAADTAGAATGSNGDVNLMYLQQGVLMEQFIIGTQTIIGPRMDANGLLVSLDLSNAEGAEYNFGGARTNSRHAFTIGTDAAFFFEVGLYINDMDGAAPYVIGFRKSEANNATMSSYTDYASIGMNAASSTTNVVTMTELNGAGQTVTDTTNAWGGDGSTNTLRVLVDASGNVTYTINGSDPAASVAFQFDNTDVVVPYIHLLHNASATAVNITSLKVGYQA